jgi:hypothetical protein
VLTIHPPGATGQKKTLSEETPSCADDGSDDMLFKGIAEHAQETPDKYKAQLTNVAGNRGRHAPIRTVNPGKIFGSSVEDARENYFLQSDE